MESLDQIKARIEGAVPGAQLSILPNDTPANQPSLLIDPPHALAVTRVLRGDAQLRMDYASNVTGVDWLEKVPREKVKEKKAGEGVENEDEEANEKRRPVYRQAGYH